MQQLLLLNILLWLVALSVSDSTLDKEWTLWKRNHGKKYKDNNEELKKRLIWEENFNAINLHNLEYSMGMHTYTLGMNFYGDMRHDEFIQRNGFLQPTENMKLGNKNSHCKQEVYADLPDSVDWRERGYVTSVMDQGQCASSTIFSVTGVMEGQYRAKSGTLVDLSAQQLFDCAGKTGGCEGGLLDLSSYDYIKKYGIEKASDYPFTGTSGQCKYNASKVVTKLRGYVKVQPSEESLKNATATAGPIAVAIDASEASFQFYTSGVYNDEHCTSQEVDHAVLVVGYGNEDGQDYWLVKNSWGTSWGENGYIKMSRNKNNQCGIASYASYPYL